MMAYHHATLNDIARQMEFSSWTKSTLAARRSEKATLAAGASRVRARPIGIRLWAVRGPLQLPALAALGLRLRASRPKSPRPTQSYDVTTPAADPPNLQPPIERHRKASLRSAV